MIFVMFQIFNKHKQTRSTPCTCANNGPCDMGAARFRKKEHQRMRTKRQRQNREKTKRQRQNGKKGKITESKKDKSKTEKRQND